MNARKSVKIIEKNPVKFVDIPGNMYIIVNCMNKYNCGNMATEQIIAQFSGKKPVVGAKQLRKALHNGKALQVFLARNADPAIVEPLAALCDRYAVRCYWVNTMKELGTACSIEVGASAAAIISD